MSKRIFETREYPTNNGDPQVTIEKHFEVFQRLVGLARESFAKAMYERSAAYVQTAGHYAWYHPTGLFVCPELEGILAQIGATLTAVPSPRARVALGEPRTILHVLTEAYGLGGHTRFVWRWIRADAARNHSVVLTRQQDLHVPTPLKEAAEHTGGKVYFLDRRPGGLLARANTLRQLATQADHIVLHTHPNDVVPLIAFSAKQRPPVTLMSENDHVFWLGASIVDQVGQLRESGQKLAQHRRGLPKSRCPLLPIPIEVKAGPSQRKEAKEKLDLSADTVVLLSVASAYKYSAAPGQHFSDVLLPVIQKHPNTVLFVIGPENSGVWASASQQVGERMRVLGKRKDIELFYSAADIYLDSFPFNSLTSTLEAGAHGAALVSYHVHSPEAEVLCTDDIGLQDLIVRAYDVESYRSRVSRLIEDTESRVKLGQMTMEGIIAYHTGMGWKQFLEQLYVPSSHPSLPEVLDKATVVHRRITELDIQLSQVFAISGWSRGFAKVIRNYAALFPLATRIQIWRDIFGSEWRYLPALLLSDWQKTRLRLLWLGS